MKSNENNRIYYVFERFGHQKSTISAIKIIKNHACNPNMFFDTSTHIKLQKVHQKWSQSGNLNSSRIDTNLHWDAQEPSRVNPGTKWSPDWYQRGLPGFQNVQKWFPRTSKINKFECKPAWNQVWFVSMINCKTSWKQLIIVWISWWVASTIKFKPSWNQLIVFWISCIQSCISLKSCSSCKSLQHANYQISWLPEGPAAGAKP